MTRTEELLALAEAATSPYADDWELKQALLKFDRAANPETIKQLVELVRLQNSALEFASDFIPTSYCNIGDCMVCETIEAFNKWENGK